MKTALDRGRDALAGAHWEDAKAAFEAALAEGDTAEVRDGLGSALWWLGDVRRAIEERERAYVAYLERGAERDAARMALWISAEQAAAYGNHAVANGWFARAERLLADEGPCAERVTLALKRAGRTPDFAAARALYDEAIAAARASGVRDQELLARSALGLFLVSRGDPEEGFALLDEAMTATVSGEVKDHAVVSLASCNMLIACERAHDLARAREWLHVSRSWAKARRCLPFFAFCRVAYGGFLVSQGDWSAAEDELVDSMRRYEDTHPALAARAAIKLAELRLEQGALDEAAELLRPWCDHALATCAVAALHVARGETEIAVSLLERRLDAPGTDPCVVASCCELLVRAHVARSELADAERAASRLASLADERSSRLFGAMADAARGEIAIARDDARATPLLQRALDVYVDVQLPFAAARARLALAVALAKTRREASVAEAKAALATFDALAAAPWSARAASVVSAAPATREAPAARPARRVGPDALTHREREVLALVRSGCSNPEIADRLEISPKTAEHHVRAILAKLNVKTRAAAAAWAARQEERAP